jgi:hypothetical protein
MVYLIGDQRTAIHEEERGDGGAELEIGAAQVGVAGAVDEGKESHAFGRVIVQRVGGALGEVDDSMLSVSCCAIGGSIRGALMARCVNRKIS